LQKRLVAEEIKAKVEISVRLVKNAIAEPSAQRSL
jgi:hypothetical protein